MDDGLGGGQEHVVKKLVGEELFDTLTWEGTSGGSGPSTGTHLSPPKPRQTFSVPPEIAPKNLLYQNHW